MTPVRLCADPGCPTVAAYRGRCQRHARESNQQINRAGQRIYRTKRWKITRQRFLFENPLCDTCGEVATDVHHRRDLADGGDPWSFANLQPLCVSCHSQITRARQQTGD